VLKLLGSENVSVEETEEKQVVEEEKIEVKIEEKAEEKPVIVEEPKRNVYVFAVTIADKEWIQKPDIVYHARRRVDLPYYKEDYDVWMYYRYDKMRDLHCIYYMCDRVYYGSSGAEFRGFVVGLAIKVVEGEFDPDLVAIKLADWYNALRIATYVESERQEFTPMSKEQKEHYFKLYNIEKRVSQTVT
jgi:hypothetical protein